MKRVTVTFDVEAADDDTATSLVAAVVARGASPDADFRKVATDPETRIVGYAVQEFLEGDLAVEEQASADLNASQLALIARLVEAEVILRKAQAPARADGTYNYSREAFEQMANDYFAPERLSLERLPDVDEVLLTEAGEAKRFGDWTAAELLAAVRRLRGETDDE